MKRSSMNPKLLLFGTFGHLLCWLGGDLLLYFVPNGPLDTIQLFDYSKTASMLAGANPMQFTISGIAGTIAMMLVLVGYYQIYLLLKPNTKVLSKVTLVGTLFTCVAGAIMHFSCTTMLWYFVKSGATKEAHDIMISFFTETMVTTALCNIGVFMVCISLFIAVVKGKTCFPKWSCVVNTIPLTLVVGILLAGIGAMNVGSALMFLGLYICVKKFSKEADSESLRI